MAHSGAYVFLSRHSRGRLCAHLDRVDGGGALGVRLDERGHHLGGPLALEGDAQRQFPVRRVLLAHAHAHLVGATRAPNVEGDTTLRGSLLQLVSKSTIGKTIAWRSSKSNARARGGG